PGVPTFVVNPPAESRVPVFRQACDQVGCFGAVRSRRACGRARSEKARRGCNPDLRRIGLNLIGETPRRSGLRARRLLIFGADKSRANESPARRSGFRIQSTSEKAGCWHPGKPAIRSVRPAGLRGEIKGEAFAVGGCRRTFVPKACRTRRNHQAFDLWGR